MAQIIPLTLRNQNSELLHETQPIGEGCDETTVSRKSRLMSSVSERSFYTRRTIWLLQIAFDNKLTRAATAVAIAISAHLNEADGDACPGLMLLADEIQASRSTVQLKIEELHDRGHILIIRGVGRTNSNRYRPVIKGTDHIGPFLQKKATDYIGPFPSPKAPIQRSKSTDRGAENVPIGGSKSTDHVGNEPKNPGGNNDQQADVETVRRAWFRRLTAAYPPNRGKITVALKEFYRLLDAGLPFQEILDAATCEAARIKGTEEIATFLGPWLKARPWELASASESLCRPNAALADIAQPLVFLTPDDPEWREWIAHAETTGARPPKACVRSRDGFTKGYWFPTRLPLAAGDAP